MNTALPALPYLKGYAPHILARVTELITEDRLADVVRQRYPDDHEVRSDRALYDYVLSLKNEHLQRAGALSKVAYDNKLKVIQHALGTHTRVSRVQGHQLKAKREIRIASLFKEAPARFLRLIVVHELAHLKEGEHDRAFYSLCMRMEPDYHQIEFDLRLWLTAREAPAFSRCP